MFKKSITSLWLIIFIGGIFSFIPLATKAIETNYQEKILFFGDKQPFAWNLTQIEFLKQKQEIIELEQYPNLKAIRIKATDDCIKAILAVYPQALMVDDYTYRAQPVSYLGSTSNQPDLNWNLDLIHVKEMWEKGFTGKGIKVAVLDTGADSAHPALEGKIKDFAFFDKSGSGIPQKVAYDTDTHGTHVSGIVAGGSLKEPLGVAPEANLSVGVVIQEDRVLFLRLLEV